MVRLTQCVAKRETDKKVDISKTRNIGIIAHIDAGKTTTTERFLFYTGKTYRIGEVDEGTAVMDWMDQERERGITITAAATTCLWKGYRINIIDTPGHVDFTAEVERSLRVLDGAIGIFCAVSGVQPQSETVWRQSERYSIPRLVYINKMDRIGADFYRSVHSIEKKLDAKVLVLNLPLGSGSDFSGIIDIVTQKALLFPSEDETEYQVIPIPSPFASLAAEYRMKLMEKLADVDDLIMDKYLSGQEITVEELRQGIRKATLSGRLFPVFCGASLKNKGTLQLLDAIVYYLPSPVDRGAIYGTNPETGHQQFRLPAEDEPVSLLIFKVQNHTHLGRLLYSRIYSGVVKTGQTLMNWSRKKKEKINKVLELNADRFQACQEAYPGDIVGLVGLKDSYTGDTLADDEHPIIFERMLFPEPVVSVSVEPRTRADQEKLQMALTKLAEEDPTVVFRLDQETGQIIFSGMGELHIDVCLEKIRRQYKLGLKLGRPQVAYRETISHEGTGEGRFVKQVAGRGQYGHVVLRLEPLAGQGKRLQFVNSCPQDKIPAVFVPAIEEGIREALEIGPLAGYPVTQILATVIDGSSHQTDSSEVAYKIAATMAFRSACQAAGPLLLEPVMKLEVTVPEEFLGEVLGDFHARRGKILHVETIGSSKVISGQVALRHTFGYATVLRSLTQGRGSYTIEFLRYEAVPEEDVGRLLHLA